MEWRVHRALGCQLELLQLRFQIVGLLGALRNHTLVEVDYSDPFDWVDITNFLFLGECTDLYRAIERCINAEQ